MRCAAIPCWWVSAVIDDGGFAHTPRISLPPRPIIPSHPLPHLLTTARLLSRLLHPIHRARNKPARNIHRPNPLHHHRRSTHGRIDRRSPDAVKGIHPRAAARCRGVACTGGLVVLPLFHAFALAVGPLCVPPSASEREIARPHYCIPTALSSSRPDLTTSRAAIINMSLSQAPDRARKYKEEKPAPVAAQKMVSLLPVLSLAHAPYTSTTPPSLSHCDRRPFAALPSTVGA